MININTEMVRGILALVVVVGVLVVCGLLAILPLIGGVQNAKDYVAVLKDFGGLFSGIVGAIVGYYFGKT
jgi:hypothetical protein